MDSDFRRETRAAAVCTIWPQPRWRSVCDPSHFWSFRDLLLHRSSAWESVRMTVPACSTETLTAPNWIQRHKNLWCLFRNPNYSVHDFDQEIWCWISGKLDVSTLAPKIINRNRSQILFLDVCAYTCAYNYILIYVIIYDNSYMQYIHVLSLCFMVS